MKAKANPITFTLLKDKEEVKTQAEFLSSYYAARLKMLRAENFNLYITAEQAAEEAFYKDMIAACMLFIHEQNNLKAKEDAKTTGEGKKLP